jgi:hypothetical protein
MLQALKKVCELLESENLEYMVSGSLAVNTYTTPRMTRDIDMVIALKEEDVERFVNLFKEGYYCDADEIKREVGRRGMFNLIENASGATIDFIIKKGSDFRNLEFERKQLTTVYGFPMWVVTAEDLLLSKLDWIQVYQSDRQISDITNLLDDNSLDLDYIRFWVEKLGLKTFDLPI